jgi:hypothetical protein
VGAAATPRRRGGCVLRKYKYALATVQDSPFRGPVARRWGLLGLGSVSILFRLPAGPRSNLTRDGRNSGRCAKPSPRTVPPLTLTGCSQPMGQGLRAGRGWQAEEERARASRLFRFRSGWTGGGRAAAAAAAVSFKDPIETPNEFQGSYLLKPLMNFKDPIETPNEFQGSY